MLKRGENRLSLEGLSHFQKVSWYLEVMKDNVHHGQTLPWKDLLHILLFAIKVSGVNRIL
jgi:hypothetical protein